MEALPCLSDESRPVPVTDYAWVDDSSRAEILRANRWARVARRAERMLQAYKALQREATILALLKAQRAAAGAHNGVEAMAHMAQ